MSYMPAHDFSTAAADCPPPRPLYLNFETKRAGRAVAESCEAVELTGALFERAVAERVLFDFWFANSTWRNWCAEDLALISSYEVGLTDVTVHDAEDDDATEVLVDWFNENQSAAEASVELGSMTAAEEEWEGEILVARRHRRGSRAWRGGGTMRRR
jgi:hypothetical protein